MQALPSYDHRAPNHIELATQRINTLEIIFRHCLLLDFPLSSSGHFM